MRMIEAEYTVREEMSHERSKHLTYNPDFDSRKYAELLPFRQVQPLVYQRRREQLDNETIFNQKTMLGERFNASLSERRDRINDGKIYGQHSDERLLTIFERGRDYRYFDSSDHDRLREAAEVESFSKIERVLADPQTPLESMMLLISPPGGENSSYQHNFYDVFTLKEENGERFIEYGRYSSALEIGEYMHLAANVSPGYFSEKEVTDLPYDVYFLSRPLLLTPGQSPFLSAEDLHTSLHRDHDTLSQEEMRVIEEACTPLILAYIVTVAENPEDIFERNKGLNAILNKADAVHEQLRKGSGWVMLYERSSTGKIADEIDYWGRLPVRETMTGCGFSGGFALGEQGGAAEMFGGSAMGPFSVMEFGFSSDRYGGLTFKCPHCNFENKRPYNQLIKYCQNTSSCGKDVSC